MKTISLDSSHTGKLMLLTAALVGSLSFPACSDNDTPQPLPEPETQYTLKLKATEIEKARSINADGKEKTLSVDEITHLFGQRAHEAAPAELHFKEDSLYIVYAGDLTEGYRMKWKGSQLTLYNEPTDTWKEAGEQKSKDTFTLNACFLNSENRNGRRNLIIKEQAYGSLSPTADAESSLLDVSYQFGK